jgi:hypothetical protein
VESNLLDEEQGKDDTDNVAVDQVAALEQIVLPRTASAQSSKPASIAPLAVDATASAKDVEVEEGVPWYC